MNMHSVAPGHPRFGTLGWDRASGRQGVGPRGALRSRGLPGDGVLVTIHWPTDFDQWNLYVDDLSTGETVAKGLDVDSNSQSLLLKPFG